MDLQLMLGIVKLIAAVAVPGTFLYFYFTRPKVKEISDKVLRFLPALLKILASRTKDDPNKFDTHDFLVLVSNVTTKIQEAVTDPTNVEFVDVQDEITELVGEELQRMKDAGAPGVPDINDSGIPTIVRVIFEQIKVAADEG